MNKSWLWRSTRENENSVQTVFRVLGNLAQTALMIIAVSGVLIFGIFAVLQILDDRKTNADNVAIEVQFFDRADADWSFLKPYGYENRPEDFISYLRRGEITIRIKGEKPDCPPAAPLLVKVTNNDKRTLECLHFKLEAYHQGRSTNVVDYDDTSQSWDFIIEPNKSITRCIPIEKNTPDGLTWAARASFAIWQKSQNAKKSPAPSGAGVER